MPTPSDWERSYLEGRHAELWDTPWPSPELAGALAVLPSGRTVDLGCGTGSDAILLAQHGASVVGVDVSATAVSLAAAKARDAGAGVEFVVADVLRLPLPDASVSLATDRGCLHYLDGEERLGYGRELQRVLRPGGLLFLRGMAAPARYKAAVTDAAIRSLFTTPAFDVVRVVAFTMLGSRSNAPGTLALIERR